MKREEISKILKGIRHGNYQVFAGKDLTEDSNLAVQLCHDCTFGLKGKHVIVFGTITQEMMEVFISRGLVVKYNFTHGDPELIEYNQALDLYKFEKVKISDKSFVNLILEDVINIGQLPDMIASALDNYACGKIDMRNVPGDKYGLISMMDYAKAALMDKANLVNMIRTEGIPKDHIQQLTVTNNVKWNHLNGDRVNIYFTLDNCNGADVIRLMKSKQDSIDLVVMINEIYNCSTKEYKYAPLIQCTSGNGLTFMESIINSSRYDLSFEQFGTVFRSINSVKSQIDFLHMISRVDMDDFVYGVGAKKRFRDLFIKE